MKVFVFSAERMCFGREVIAVTNTEPTTEQMWELLESNLRERSRIDPSFADFELLLDQYAASDFVVQEMEVRSIV